MLLPATSPSNKDVYCSVSPVIHVLVIGLAFPIVQVLNSVPLKDMLKSQPPVPQNATSFGNRVIALVKIR